MTIKSTVSSKFMNKAVAPLLVAVCFFLAASARAECPDADVQCVIPTSAVGTVTSSQGCDVGGNANVGFEGEVPNGSIEINGSCFNSFTDSTGFSYIPMGVVQAGQCFDFWAFSCQVEHCSGQTTASVCNSKVDSCTVKQLSCTNYYNVQAGDACWTIANNNGMTLNDLQGMNPDVSCDNLQVNQSLCLGTTWTDGQALCQGKKVSGRRLRLASVLA
jgi:hypothetical protein